MSRKPKSPKAKKSEGPRPYARDDILASKHVIDASLAPDASFAVYELSEIAPGKTPDDDKQTSSLWRVDLAGGKPARLTAKGASASAPQLARDGRSVFFLRAADAAGRPQIWRLPLDGGEAQAVTSLEQGVAAYALSPDGKRIAFAALEKTPAPPAPNTHVRISRTAYRFDPVPGYLQNVGHALYVAPVSGEKPKAITPHDGLIQAMEWSPDGKKIAAIFLGREAKGACAILGDLAVVGLDGEETTLVTDSMISGFFWTADGRRVGYIGTPGAGRLDRESQLFLVSAEGGTPVSRTAGLGLAVAGGHQAGSPSWAAKSRIVVSPDGKSVIAPVTQGGEGGLWSIALEGDEAATPIITGPRVCKAVAGAGGTVLFTAQDFTTPSELFAADIDGKKERAVTHHNDAWRKAVAWPRIERVTAQSAPGVEIEGWVFMPAKGKGPHKTLLMIHGGPHAGWGHTFNEDFQELAGAGWAVAIANPRGSTGYGDAFSGAIVGCWGHPELEDFNAFLDELVKRGLADPDRLGVSGVSGGGHLTGWLIGHTNRFKAAVPEQGVYNMFSMFGVSDAGADLISLEMGGEPHEKPELYWALSPVAHAHKCVTPTLVIQGENDVRCPMEQAEQLYAVLKRAGCEAEFLRLSGCNHGLQVMGPPHLRRARMDALTDWFERHIV
jgi:dipeptidyl aminopeptidase/acylaminoacyl peptidase